MVEKSEKDRVEDIQRLRKEQPKSSMGLTSEEEAYAIAHENRVTYHLNETILNLNPSTLDLDLAQQHLVEAHETTTCPSCKKKMETALAKMLTAATMAKAGSDDWVDVVGEVKSDVENVRDFMPEAVKIQLERRRQSGKPTPVSEIPRAS